MTKELYEIFEERVKAVLKENGELDESGGQSLAAKRWLMEFRYINKWGKPPYNRIRLIQIVDFAKEYNVSLDYLLGLRDEMY